VIVSGCVLATAVASAIVFGPGLDNGFVSDDWVFLYSASRAVTLADALHFFTFNTTWFVRPVQQLVTWILYQSFHQYPVPYHALSTSLHLINALLLGTLGYRLMGSMRKTKADLLPAVGLAISPTCSPT
jgi:hypothetical protein